MKNNATSLTPITGSLIITSPPPIRSRSDKTDVRRCLESSLDPSYSKAFLTPESKENVNPDSNRICSKRASPQEYNRTAESEDDTRSPFLKKRWKSSNLVKTSSQESHKVPPTQPVLERSISGPAMRSLGQMQTYTMTLPTTRCRKHPDLNVVSPQTVERLVNGEFDSRLKNYFLIDCRFSYEHEGGCIKGSLHLSHPDTVEEKFLLSPDPNSTRVAILFYCEFSANRAPKMIRHFRNLDRWIHSESYPKLYYPELYLIDGGYKNCFETTKQICFPPKYTTMVDEAFAKECKESFSKLRDCWKKHGNAKCVSRLQEIHREMKFPNRETSSNRPNTQ